MKRSLKGVSVFVILCLALFVVGNWQAVQSEVSYAVSPPVASQLSAAQLVSLTDTKSSEGDVLPDRIVIPKIGVDAPVVANIPAEQMDDFLDKGVVQLKDGGKPGQNGNLFLSGHSSDYIWKHDPYASVFSLLPKLERGDMIEVSAQGKLFAYRTVSTEIVTPDQVSIASPTKGATITLMTCYPIGTANRRYVVHGELVK